MSSRRKSRLSPTRMSSTDASSAPSSARSFISTSTTSDYPRSGRKPRASVVMDQPSGDFPSGRKPRASVAMDQPSGEFPTGRKPRASVAMDQPSGEFPTGRKPRASVAMDQPSEDFPTGRKPRSSVVMEGDKPTPKKRATVVLKEGQFKEEEIDEEEREREAKRRRKRIAMIIACILTLIVIIIIIVILVNVFKTGDEPTNVTPPDAGVPEACAINNETKPATYEDFMCDLMTTLTTEESTFLRTYPVTTHYGRTVAWMTTSDQTDFNSLPRENVLERFVMILFYYSTGGREWYKKFEFLTPEQHLCDWTGDSTNAIRCAFTDRKVTDLGLPDNGMNGEVPSEIGYLTGLTRIYFSINQLSGKIPSEIGKLTKLKKLYFDRNNMRGKIPEEINALNLTTLALNNNDFNGNLTGICDAATAKAAAVEGFEFDYHSDCDTGRVNCPCCETCN